MKDEFDLEFISLSILENNGVMAVLDNDNNLKLWYFDINTNKKAICNIFKHINPSMIKSYKRSSFKFRYLKIFFVTFNKVLNRIIFSFSPMFDSTKMLKINRNFDNVDFRNLDDFIWTNILLHDTVHNTNPKFLMIFSFHNGHYGLKFIHGYTLEDYFTNSVCQNIIKYKVPRYLGYNRNKSYIHLASEKGIPQQYEPISELFNGSHELKATTLGGIIYIYNDRVVIYFRSFLALGSFQMPYDESNSHDVYFGTLLLQDWIGCYDDSKCEKELIKSFDVGRFYRICKF